MSQPSDLDELLDMGEPTPDFDARFFERLSAAQAEEAAVVNRLLDLDQPVPSADFDARFQARMAGAKVLPFRRRNLLIGVGILALAATLVFFVLRPAPPEAMPEEDLAMLAHLDLLENLEEVEVLDALEDPAVFALVADLDEVAPAEEGRP